MEREDRFSESASKSGKNYIGTHFKSSIKIGHNNTMTNAEEEAALSRGRK